MAHFTEYAAVCRGDTFDCSNGTVWIEAVIQSWIAVVVHVLGSDLTVSNQLFQQLIADNEAALTVGNCDGVDREDW